MGDLSTIGACTRAVGGVRLGVRLGGGVVVWAPFRCVAIETGGGDLVLLGIEYRLISSREGNIGNGGAS